jgi:hypothetical protein
VADRLTLADVMAAVAGRLMADIDDPAVAVSDLPPDTTQNLPAVWPEALSGGGVGSRDRPCLVRVVWVPAQRDNRVQHPDIWAAVDALDLAFDRAQLADGILLTGRAWTVDGHDIGGVTRDAVLYDLTLTYSSC